MKKSAEREVQLTSQEAFALSTTLRSSSPPFVPLAEAIDEARAIVLATGKTTAACVSVWVGDEPAIKHG